MYNQWEKFYTKPKPPRPERCEECGKLPLNEWILDQDNEVRETNVPEKLELFRIKAAKKDRMPDDNDEHKWLCRRCLCPPINLKDSEIFQNLNILATAVGIFKLGELADITRKVKKAMEKNKVGRSKDHPRRWAWGAYHTRFLDHTKRKEENDDKTADGRRISTPGKGLGDVSGSGDNRGKPGTPTGDTGRPEPAGATGKIVSGNLRFLDQSIG